jgi:HD-GYP domain-containing protein (c-di-GMP phosphodiesterase class II)
VFRISDILKKHKEEKEKRGEEKKTEPVSIEEVKPQELPPPLRKESETKEITLSVSAAVDKEIERHPNLKLGEAYEETVFKARQFYRVDLDYELGFISGINALIEKIIDLLTTDNDKELLRLCLTDYPKIEDYLYYHAANVSIISLEIGRGLGYERGRLIELGIAAFVHDIGIVKYLEIISQPRVLSKYEYSKVKEHPAMGLEILNNIAKGLSPAILDAVRQEHERLDGSGYPQGLEDDKICEYAQIIGLADVYEALLHPRPYRRKYTPLEAIETILDNKSAFAGSKIKALIESAGIFPVGTLVALNTKEVGAVIKDNPDLVLRPVVNVILDAYGNALKEPKQIDLAKNPMVYIEDCLESLEKKYAENPH